MDRIHRLRLTRRRTFAIGATLAAAIVALVVWRPWSDGSNRFEHLRSLRGDPSPIAVDADTESRIVAFCGDCHAMLRAESFPRDAWHDKVRQGYYSYARSGRNDLDPPPMHLTLAYFRSHAPEKLVFPEPLEAETELRVAFAIEKRFLEQEADVPPAIAHLRWTRLDASAAPALVVCDMRLGSVDAVDLRDPQLDRRRLARLNHPCHVEPCDLDANQATDLVVADLGSFFPNDHDRGRVVWLRRLEAVDAYEEVVVASRLGRVADVRPADFDADGDVDLIVAEFGHYRTGKIVLLRNIARQGTLPRFEQEDLDPRPGTIHVPVDDLDDDGLLDFVALVSQEYERVDAFLNQADGQFRVETLWAGPDLTFGSSGIELVDLDQDGDVDILYTNGDAFDNNYVNPSHGVGWLENLGGLRFDHHRLTDLLGAYRALAGDVDLDGDLDVVAVAYLPTQPLPVEVAGQPLPSIVCLEQTTPGVFVRHTLEIGSPRYATLELADFDDDGDLDFAVGPHMIYGQETSHWLAIGWNQGVLTRE
ncbi:MAG: FG-GAP repeat domain-containing protein [Planctomycetota bacterium]|jgi:hypothetical protein